MRDEDLQRYGAACLTHRGAGGCPEWVELDLAELMNEDAGLVELIEERWDLTPSELEGRLARGSLKALRAFIWVARRKAGCRDDIPSFRPHTQDNSGITWEQLPAEAARVEELPREADAGPPVEVPVPNRAEKRAAKKAPAPARTGPSGT
jgi:hypothetical protein